VANISAPASDGSVSFGACTPNTTIPQVAAEIQAYMQQNNLTWAQFQASPAGENMLRQATSAGDLPCLETALGVASTSTSSGGSSLTADLSSIPSIVWIAAAALVVGLLVTK
jgi:hypothetical protein